MSGKPIGGVRSGQMVTTFGVGSLVAIGDQSFVVSGIDSWHVNRDAPLLEPRLQQRLKVREFFVPPADDLSAGDGVRVRRFPEMYSCPGCNELKPYKFFGAKASKNRCSLCEKTLVPSRFVVACENGHLDDFPYWQWVHKRNTVSQGKHQLEMHSDGRTASLRSVVIKCSCGLSASMEGAFGKRALAFLKLECSGRRPWLGAGATEPSCDAVPRTLQRGASAAWFAINRSALSIPPWSETLSKHVVRHRRTLQGAAGKANALEIVQDSGILDGTPFSAHDALDAYERWQNMSEDVEAEAESAVALEALNPFRLEEYEPLCFGTGEVEQGADFECVRPSDHDVAPPAGIERSMLVKRLREVRALYSFTRVEAPDALPDKRRFASLSKQKLDWLPAIEVSGEGVFLALDQKQLTRWESQAEPARRAAMIRDRHTDLLVKLARRRGDVRSRDELRSPVSARYLLLHSLAHVLINEWSLDSGYPAASLRERLYVADGKTGVLIYTATSDSAGSLGGVIAQGKHERLAESLASALGRIEWCSQDPPCMESEATGVDSLNLAACYACVMVPESSCETNNTFLDRALLIGTPDDPMTGYFRFCEA
ncbi:DrmB family protein [Lentzea sp. HUAS TT2]|uniref:DrmB family protein n=1 Tax=Lentzea sp. HUAS TT2 TaxID=3447454 RepID=UPI003F710A7A